MSRPATPQSPAPSPASVAGATLTATAAVAAMAARDMLPLLHVVLGILLLLAVGVALVLWPDLRAAQQRRNAGAPVLASYAVVTLVLLLRDVQAAAGDRVAVTEAVTGALPYLLLGLLVGQLWLVSCVRELVMTVVISGLCLLLTLGTVPRDSPADVTSVLGLCVGLAWSLGLTTLWLLHGTRERAAATYAVPGRRAPAAVPAALVVVPLAVALLALLLPTPSGVRTNAVGAGPGALGPASTSAPRDREVTSYLGSRMDLNTRGDLGDTPLLLVPAGAPTLWGSTVLTRYDGRTWDAEPGTDGVAPLDATGASDLRPGAVEGAAPGAADREDTVRVLGESLLPVVAPGQMVSVRMPVRAFRQPGGVAYPMDPRVDGYAVRSSGVIVDDVDPVDVSLPSTVPDRVRRLAVRLTAGRDRVQDKVSAIEAYLHARLRYRLDSPVPGEDEDAVDDFLFESREGYCEHFAAAEAVLLRAVGVPARVVTGFAGGDLQSGGRVLREKNAHAWVQVYAGDGQWFWTDPTAGATLAEAETSAAAEPSAAVEWLQAHWWQLLLGAGAALGLVGAVWLLLRRARTRRAAAALAASPLAVQVLASYAALERALRPTPLARRPDASVEELRVGLLARWPGALPDRRRLSDAFQIVQHISYSNQEVPDAQARAALSALEQARQFVLAQTATATRRRGGRWRLARTLLPGS